MKVDEVSVTTNRDPDYVKDVALAIKDAFIPVRVRRSKDSWSTQVLVPRDQITKALGIVHEVKRKWGYT